MPTTPSPLTLAQPAEAFRLNVDVGITMAGQPARIERVAMNNKRATVSFAAPAEPTAVSLDPGTWLLMDVAAFSKAR